MLIVDLIRILNILVCVLEFINGISCKNNENTKFTILIKASYWFTNIISSLNLRVGKYSFLCFVVVTKRHITSMYKINMSYHGEILG